MRFDPQDLIDALGQHSEAKGGDELIFNCPYCEARGDDRPGLRLYVNINKGVFNCFRCSGAGVRSSGSVRKLFRYLGITNKIAPSRLKSLKDELYFSSVDVETPSELLSIKPPEFRTFYSYEEIYDDEAVASYEYAKARGLTDRIIRHYKLSFGINKHQNRLIFPEMLEEKFVFWQARAVNEEDEPKYLNPIIMNKPIYNAVALEDYETIVITEGVISAIACGFNAVALFGKYLTEYQFDLLNACSAKTLIILLDGDANTDAIEIAKELSEFTTKTVKLNFFKSLSSDPASVSKSEVKSLISSASILRDTMSLRCRLNSVKF